MSARVYGEYAIMLSYYPSVLSGMEQTEYRKVTDKQLRAFLATLRKKSRKEGWTYTLELSPSTTDPRTGKEVRLHVHMYIQGNPITTIMKFIKDYWRSKYGIADATRGYDKVGFLGYMKAQAMYTKTQTEGDISLENISGNH